MVGFRAPDVYVIEESMGPRTIEAVGTSVAAFLGRAPAGDAPAERAVAVNDFGEFERRFVKDAGATTALANAVFGFFANGGGRCYVVDTGDAEELTHAHVDRLTTVDEVAIVAAPGFTDAVSYDVLLSHVEDMGDRFAVLDAPAEFGDVRALTRVAGAEPASSGGDEPAPSKPRASDHGAFYAPNLVMPNPVTPEAGLVHAPPSGAVAGIYARTDAERGVHKAPANTPVRGAVDLTYRFNRDEQALLNPAGVNCLRHFVREGLVVWGARTLSSDPEWRYVPVRRLFTMIVESIRDGTRHVVFEPNDRATWAAIRRDVGDFLKRLWRAGALMGATPEQAFFVKCDRETNPPEVVEAGQVVTVVGLAPVRPAEFVVFRLGQSREGTEVEGA